MSTYKSHQYNCECEFEVPIKLNVPITINPILSIKSVAKVEETLNAVLGTNIFVNPEVGATKPNCLPKPVYPDKCLPVT